jgi:hypothetical protein
VFDLSLSEGLAGASKQDVAAVSSARPCLSLILRGISVYLAVLLDDAAADMECNWIRPIPKPPTAPASSPSMISTGTLSSRLFFRVFAILCSPQDLVPFTILPFAIPLPHYGGTVSGCDGGFLMQTRKACLDESPLSPL